MILAEYEKHCTCNICGVKVAHCGKAEHFKKFHPEYSFHRAKGRYFCDICGKSIQSYEYLVKFHNHSRQISESNIIGKSKEGEEMVLTPAEKRNVCDACGERLISGRKAEHFKKFHPEYSFHHTKERYLCDICGLTIQDYSRLVKFHNHSRQINEFNIMGTPKHYQILSPSWLLENYYKIATFYIDCLDKSKTMKEFKITAYI